jgi:hypothetical protein
VNGNTAVVVAQDFAFPRVEPGTDFYAKRLSFVGNRAGAAHPTRRAVEGGKNAVAGRLDLMAAKQREVAPDRYVSVKSTVASTVSAATGAFAPVRNSPMPSAISIALSPIAGM